MKWAKIGTIAGKDGINGKDGVSPDPGAIAELVLARVPTPKDGKDAAPIDYARIVLEVAKQIPPPKDGKDAPPVDVHVVIAEVLRQIPTPKDGASVTLEQAIPLLEAGVTKWMLEWERRAQEALVKAADRIPAPKDGRDGDRGSPGEKGDAGKDGVGIERLEVDQKSVEFILTDGTSAVVELPVGPQGEKGLDGTPGLRGEKGDAPSAADLEAVVMRLLPDMIHKEVEAAFQRHMDYLIVKTAALVPAGRDGPPGAPGRPGARGEDGDHGKDGIHGRDGVSIDGLRVKHVGGRKQKLIATKSDGSEQEVQFVMEGMLLDCGIHKTNSAYEMGDVVTRGGSYWVAKTATTGTPGESPDWRLVVKRGRDGKDADE
jgi:hypothetical protein